VKVLDFKGRLCRIRSSNGPSFRLVGVLKRLDPSAQAAAVEAKRLAGLEAP